MPIRWLVLLMLAGCNGGIPILSVDLTTDLRPAVDFTRVRTELSDVPFSDGPLRIETLDHPAAAGEDYAGAVRIAELEVTSRATGYLRVSLLDVSGRIRGQRLAIVEVTSNRSVTIVIESACRDVICPGAGDPADAIACVNGTCAPATCTPEDPSSCPIACTSDDLCPIGSECQRPSCVSGSCLLVDDCASGEICGASGCEPAPSCGDLRCDPSTETPCGCDDCGVCPSGCLDGMCATDEVPASCPEDCGPPDAVCGDTICEHDEDCPSDCGGAIACGDPGCESCDVCDACCDVGCGDRQCNEPMCECEADCGVCSTCGDLRCDVGEDCPADCTGPVCGDGTCLDGMGESCGNCQRDCGWCGFGTPQIAVTQSCTGRDGSGDGATCGGLEFAWTSAADNVGYYPMQVARATDLVSGEGRVIRTLSVLTPVGIQSTRNPNCLDTAPLRPAVEGWVFGYVRGEVGSETTVGWMLAADLILDDMGGECAAGAEGSGFQVATNPYSRSPICEPFECTGVRSCRAANPIGEGSSDCGGTRVDYERGVDADTLALRFAPAGTPRRFLHRGDRVRVLYEGGRDGYVFVQALTSATPILSPVGSRGWVVASYLVP